MRQIISNQTRTGSTSLNLKQNDANINFFLKSIYSTDVKINISVISKGLFQVQGC